MISLDNLVKVEESNTPPTIYHFNRYKSATISAGLQPGKTIGDGIKEMERISDKLMDETFATSYPVHQEISLKAPAIQVLHSSWR